MLARYNDLENTFALMDELRRRMDRVWDDSDPSWQGASPRSFSASVFPRINVYDGGSTLVLKADVPGLSEKDVQLTLNEGGLSLSGERRVAPPEGYSAHRQERSHVKFSRSLQLPCKVDPEQTTAAVKNGVLTITLAKAAEAQPRQSPFGRSEEGRDHAMNNATQLAKHANGSVEPVQHHDTIAPPVDVYESGDELLVVADVPGASHDGIDVQLEKGQLTILARRIDETTGAPVAREYRAHDYFRIFSVPHGIDASKIDAQLTAGVLRLRLPKSESLKPRRIEVKQG